MHVVPAWWGNWSDVMEGVGWSEFNRGLVREMAQEGDAFCGP
jgi:hypothetical protein